MQQPHFRDLLPSESWYQQTFDDVETGRGGTTQTTVVIDDDPTGTQPVRDVPVVTRWTRDDLMWALGRDTRLVFVSTNSRSLSAHEAARVTDQVVRASLDAAGHLRKTISFVSRGDSTLRGHLWPEVQAMLQSAASAGQRIDAILFVPAYPDAGRITYGSAHFLIGDAGRLIPLSTTDYADDPSFAYTSSDLPEFLESATNGVVRADQVLRVSLGTLRMTSLVELVALLRRQIELAKSQRNVLFIVPDIAHDADLRRVAAAMLVLQRDGVHCLARSGPGLPKAMKASHEPPDFDPSHLRSNTPGASLGPGLVVVGSHVSLSTVQLDHLRESLPRPIIELEVERLLADGHSYQRHIAQRLIHALHLGSAVFATSRALVSNQTDRSNFQIARLVAETIIGVTREVIDNVTDLSYMVAKGGITSSTLFSEALGASRAMVRGSLLPGLVSVWEPVDGRRPLLPYVVFAGNVGGPESLTHVVRTLERDHNVSHHRNERGDKNQSAR